MTDRAREKLVAGDGSVKYRFQTEHAALCIEAAAFYVPTRVRPHIACVSTQLGCAVGCQFCTTAYDKFVRNLTSSEIVLQATTILDAVMEAGASESECEVSFMGMGEPLANRRHLLAAIGELHLRYPSMSRMSVSTAGPAGRIRDFARELCSDVPIHLQISLHSTKDDVRRRLIPYAPESIVALLSAGQEYHDLTGDHVCLNYVLLPGINDAAEDADWLAAVPDRRAFYVKVSMLNEIPMLPSHLRAPTMEQFTRFSEMLRERGVPHQLFRGDGLDVAASCGQLAARPVMVFSSIR